MRNGAKILGAMLIGLFLAALPFIQYGLGPAHHEGAAHHTEIEKETHSPQDPHEQDPHEQDPY